MNRLIAAVDRSLGIGKHGIIPWKIPEDEAFFTNQTKTYGGNVLTGGVTFRETYHGPLQGRQNFILSHNRSPIDGVTVVNDLSLFLKDFKADLWVAGGEGVFRLVMELDRADELYLTFIDAEFGCDRFFPEFQDKFALVEQTETKEQNGFHFAYARYQRKTT